MSQVILLAMVAISILVLQVAHAVARSQDDREGRGMPMVGPRDFIGPDVPLSSIEKKEFAKHIVVEGLTDVAVQTSCERAVEENIRAVFLPAGRYVFEKEVSVSGGLTIFGAGSQTVCQTESKNTHLFRADGHNVRFTRLKLQGADTTPSTDNDTYGISAHGKENVRIDHCELLGFSYATAFGSEGTSQIDHCYIHHNLRDGLGYGIAIYSGAYVLVADNEFSQNRHSLASNGALDWSSPKQLGRYVHQSGVRKTHWEFIHNRVLSNDESPYELCAVDTHPGMDGTFVIEGNIFENLRHGVGIRDGSGLIRGNVFRSLRTVTDFRPLIAISISYGTHNNIPVEGCMPHDIEVEGNIFLMEGTKYEKCSVGKAENIIIDGEIIPETKADRPAPSPLPRLVLIGSAYFPPPESEGGWRKNTDPDFIRSLGVDPVKLEEFGKYNMSLYSHSGKKGCIVIKNGWIVGEWYEGTGAETYLNGIASNSKAWAMLLFGILATEDPRFSVESKVYDPRWLPEGFPLSDPRKSEITFEHIFKHTSGILSESTGDTNSADNWNFQMYTVGRDQNYPESASLYSDPGTKSDYSSVAYNHLTLVFRNATGMFAKDYLPRLC